MPTREQVLHALGDGRDYPHVAIRLGIPAGRAFMIATGLPADGSDGLAAEDLQRPGMLEGSTQHLVNPPVEVPTRKDHVTDWMRGRARADATMQSAARARNAEPGEINDPDDDHDVTVVLGRDHNQINALLQQLKAIPAGPKGGNAADTSRRESIVDMITVAASGHEAVEEVHFWPRVRKDVPDGDALADQAIEQEKQGAQTLAKLGKAQPGESEFDELVGQLVSELRKHVAFEDKVFLAVRSAVDADGRQEWGETIRKAEERAPTRPHPHAPRGAKPLAAAAGVGGAAADKVRDKAGDRPAERKGKASRQAKRKAATDEAGKDRA